MCAIVKSALSRLGAFDVDVDELRTKDFEKAKTGSASMIPRYASSMLFCKVPVRANRCLSSAEVPDSWRASCEQSVSVLDVYHLRTEGAVKCKVPHSAWSLTSESSASVSFLILQVFRPSPLLPSSC